MFFTSDFTSDVTMKILINVDVYVETSLGIVGECVQCLYEKTKDSKIKELIDDCLNYVIADYENRNVTYKRMKISKIITLDNGNF